MQTGWFEHITNPCSDFFLIWFMNASLYSLYMFGLFPQIEKAKQWLPIGILSAYVGLFALERPLIRTYMPLLYWFLLVSIYDNQFIALPCSWSYTYYTWSAFCSTIFWLHRCVCLLDQVLLLLSLVSRSHTFIYDHVCLYALPTGFSCMWSAHFHAWSISSLGLL